MKKQYVYSILGLICTFLVLNSSVFADENDIEKVRQKLPQLLGANNVGTDFWITFNPCWETYNPQNALKIYVSSGTKTLVSCEVPGWGFREQKMTVPNDVIEFSLQPGIGQCYQKTDMDKTRPEQLYQGRAVHISAEDPIIVYGVTRFQYTSDGFLALPTSSLGKEYIVASFADPTTENFGSFQYLPSQTSIVAPYDGTKVRFIMGGNVWTKTAGGMSPGETETINMNQGDVWLVGSISKRGDLSGSKVISNKPVAVISGNYCAYIPSEFGYCDFIIEQELPTNTWGKKYHVSQIATRRKNSLLKVFVKEPLTTLYRNGRQMGTIPEAGGLEGKGWIEVRLDEEVNQPWVWGGNKPISVTQFNPGQDYDGVPSDPFQLVLTPIEQYQTEITFNTPGIRGGYGYPDNYINIVYLGEENGEIPEDLEFAQVFNGQFSWKKVSSISPSAGFLFKDDQQKGRQYYSKTIMLPGDGVYKLRARDPFCAYAYGFSSYDSYGFPTSVALGDLEKPDTLAPDPKWVSDCGNIKGATVEDMPKDPEVRSNLALIYFNKDDSYNYKFSFEPFEAGTDFKTTWELEVINPLEDAVAYITFIDRRGNDTVLKIEYFATKFDIEPKYFDFGLLQTGDVREQEFKITNLSKGPTEFNKLVLQKGTQNFEIIGGAMPKLLQPNESYPFIIRFTAREEGEFRDSIGTGDICVFKYIPLVVASVGTPFIEVTDANWGDMTVGTTDRRRIEIHNNGTTQLIITGYSGPSNTNYKPVNLQAISPTNQLLIKPHGVYKFDIDFTPTDEIEYPDQIVFESNAKGTDNIAVLWGRGIKASLVANSYDWGRQKINRPKSPQNAYDPTERVIILRNNGTDDVTIPNININDVYGNGNAFKFDKFRFNNLVVKKKDSVYVPVTFLPTEVGKHRIEITYPGNTAGSDTKTILEGIGIEPRMATIDMDFGTTVIMDISNIQKRTIYFVNTPWSDTDGTDVSDELTITGFNINPNNSISTNLTNWGSEGFKFDQNDVVHISQSLEVGRGLPATLQPGDTLFINAEFVAQKVGPHAGTITTISDVELEQSSDWTGFGVAQGVYVRGGSSRKCITEEEIIVCEVGNSGSGNITVTSVYFDPPIPEFTFVDPNVTAGFELEPNKPKQILVRYRPTVVGNFTTKLVIENTTLDNPIVSDNLNGIAEHYARTTSNSVTDEDRRLIGGESFLYRINLNPGDDLSLANVQEFSLTVRYKKDFIVALRDKITIGDFINNDFTMSAPQFTSDAATNIESITLIFTAKTGRSLNGNGELLEIGFSSFLPWYRNDSESNKLDSAFIGYDITATGTKCLDLSNDQTSVYLMPTCVNNLRSIKISENRYALQQIAPNPIGSNGGEIQFSVALQGYTEIRIINSAGDISDMIVASDLAPGEYAIPIPVDKLGSGSYIVTMSSGPFYSQQKLVIHK